MHSFRKKVNGVGGRNLRPESLQFCMFTTDDIKKLAVAKIVSPLTFDALGYPLPGGLHDKRLGPLNEKSDPCATCLKNVYACPGHFGYIDLPLPVVNPLFHKVIGTVIKSTCLQCFHIQIPSHIKSTLHLQIKLLNNGLISAAMDLQNLVLDLIVKYNKCYNLPEEEFGRIKEYEKLLLDAPKSTFGSKNTESLKNQLCASLWEHRKGSKKCINCSAPISKVDSLKNKLILQEKVVISDLDGSVKSAVSKHLTPEQCRNYMREVWKVEKDFLKQIVPVLESVQIDHPTDVLFFEVVPVVPSNVRPVNVVNGMMNEHPQTRLYKRLVQDAILLRAIVKVMKSGDGERSLSAEALASYKATRGETAVEKLSNAWESLQLDANYLMDYDGRLSGEQGLKQLIERKSGIIRMHMMGKRVNFAARSVITPDPNLSIEEIGIPEAFAKHLTYPVPVTSWNVEHLRKLIMNGPKVHPGAVMVEFADGRINRIDATNPVQQEALLKRLLTPDGPEEGFRGLKTVHRHLCNGDVLLLNRQPTLHRPSIMAHVARVLKGEKTLRLHYANCKAYNADFDGDEMNAHFPQNEVARSEAYNLANVANQYLVPKDGTPLSGLIQDHVIAGVKMTRRGRFFERHDYQQLVYHGLAARAQRIRLLGPAILKPRPLWSGKQIISTVILNLVPRGRHAINLKARAKIPAKAWITQEERPWEAGGTAFRYVDCMSEAEVVIREGQLLVGVLDKAHYGATPYGLVHCMYELYGGSVAVKLLSSLAKLFTSFLQMEGFTLGVHDILVTAEADRKRKKIIERSRTIGSKAMCKALNIDEQSSNDVILQVVNKHSNQKIRSIVDREYKQALDSYTNEVNKVCLPSGLICKFPNNNLQLMVQSGAKGSTVNTMQISCMLGQIELEGKRPPLMISGRSLPSFPAWEWSPRAGGYIDGRFMTGIQPQEFFFHCMAGREGLIDTAVKTSRSGYLQRCLIKHLEGLTVGYDMTVRDCDQSVIQFRYGEDGMDVTKVQFLNEKQLPFLVENAQAVCDKQALEQLTVSDAEATSVRKHLKRVQKWRESHPLSTRPPSAFTLFSSKVAEKVSRALGDKCNDSAKKKAFVVDLWSRSDEEIRRPFLLEAQKCPDPVSSAFSAGRNLKVLDERLQGLIEGIAEAKKRNVIRLKATQSACAPGEPVGLLAAQSIGEPSTQMTLNTFHFAGRGEMNVTLGIPRLREILMMASRNLKTPSMEVPFLPGAEHRADKLRKVLTRVVLADVLEKVHVVRVLETQPRLHRYTVRFHFMPQHLYRSKFNVRAKRLVEFSEKVFLKMMFTCIRRYAKVKSDFVTSAQETVTNKKTADGDDEAADDEAAAGNDRLDSSSDEEPEDAEDAKANYKYQDKHQESDVDDDANDGGQQQQQQNAEDEQQPVDGSSEQLFKYDRIEYRWCEVCFTLPLAFKKVDLGAVIRDVAAKAVIWETPGIRRAITYMVKDRLTLRTDGINLQEMFKYDQILDLRRLYTNDIHGMAETYGVEAAARVIVKEVRDVFNVYGISVDPRHLLLVADYMTYSGRFEPLSRKGMESSASPLQQISFESSLTFLRAATINGKKDALQNPSSCLMVGKPCTTGTGAFSLLHKVV